jgi:predicted short-subunit dehydrogenase-like oxidoreductase (DUF2520 family)
VAKCINIIGAGQLGQTLARLVVSHQSATIQAVCNQSLQSSQAAIDFIGEGKSYAEIAQLPAAEITWICTADDKIAAVAQELHQNQALKTGTIVLHFSGALDSSVLLALKERGCFIASVHPMRSFASPAQSVDDYPGTYCAMEGDLEALEGLEALFISIGSIPYRIEKKHKSLYHAAAVFASNYLLTLAEEARRCLNVAGVEQALIIPVIHSLMQSTLNNLQATQSPQQSLTGPLQRGDTKTLLKHLKVLLNDEQKKLYSILGEATLNLSKLSDEKKAEIQQVLNQRIVKS